MRRQGRREIGSMVEQHRRPCQQAYNLIVSTRTKELPWMLSRRYFAFSRNPNSVPYVVSDPDDKDSESAKNAIKKNAIHVDIFQR
jgi:hypothetical protein